MKLKLDAETEEQEQTIMEFRLQREKDRTKLSECTGYHGERVNGVGGGGGVGVYGFGGGLCGEGL